MSSTSHDRGLQAVRRVRSAREQDSRLGLARAVVEQQAAARRVEELTSTLATAADSRTGGDAGAYAAHRAGLLAVGHLLGSARGEAESAGRVVRTSRDHWLADHHRLESVDLLLERRRAERADEAARRTARDDDEIGTDVWRRNGASR